MTKKTDAKSDTTTKKKRGRPSTYTEELGRQICDAVATSPWGLRRIIKECGFPEEKVIRSWVYKKKDFGVRYALAKAAQADVLVEECLNIADDCSNDYIEDENGKRVNVEALNRSRTRIDTRKWIASKLAPKVYGDPRFAKEVSEENDALRKELAELREELERSSKKDY